MTATQPTSPVSTLRRLLAEGVSTVFSVLDAFLKQEDAWVQARENGEGELPRVTEKIRKDFELLKSKAERVKSVLSCLAESAEEGQLVLPEGVALTCLKSPDSKRSCCVFALPGKFGLSKSEESDQSEGFRILLYGSDNPMIRPILEAKSGSCVIAPWDGEFYTVETTFSARGSS
jgi:hypothetical protein